MQATTTNCCRISRAIVFDLQTNCLFLSVKYIVNVTKEVDNMYGVVKNLVPYLASINQSKRFERIVMRTVH